MPPTNPLIKGILYPRAHLSLIGLNNDGYRKFGGIGFSYDTPNIKFSVTESHKNAVKIFDNANKLISDNNLLSQRIDAVCREKGIAKSYAFIVNMQVPRHHGAGSGTNIALACIEAVFILNNMEYTESELIELSSRGRTSGIGIKTYFNGGYVMDIGVKNLDNIFLPSNANSSNLIAQNLVHTKFPDWEFVVCFPKKMISLTKKEELLFFNNSLPLAENDVYKILYISCFGITSAILENDFDTFYTALVDLQKTKWKSLERNNFGSYLNQIENIIYNCGACAVAMSSLGPSLIAFSKDVDAMENQLKKHHEILEIYRTGSINKGRILYA